MKIECSCGAIILDGTDALPHKAHVVPDQEWDAMLEAVDGAIERAAARPAQLSDALRSAREAVIRAARPSWQCRECGRLYLDDTAHQAREFLPGSDESPREIFRTRA